MLILLPPSEGKSVPRRGKPLDLHTLSFPGLTPTRARVLDALVRLCRDDAGRAAKVLGLGPTQVDDVRRNAALREAPTTRADALYTGVLYDHLDLAGLDAASRRRATRQVAVTSSLFGLVRPGDRLPSYRLAGGVRLPDLGPVASLWRPVLGEAVVEAAGRGLVVDLRSSTYAAFWRPTPDVAPRAATVRVLHEQAGRRSVVSHFNKATKGRLVASLLDAGASPTTPARLAETLRDLGWHVEPGSPTATGTQLDVVVSEV